MSINVTAVGPAAPHAQSRSTARGLNRPDHAWVGERTVCGKTLTRLGSLPLTPDKGAEYWTTCVSCRRALTTTDTDNN